MVQRRIHLAENEWYSTPGFLLLCRQHFAGCGHLLIAVLECKEFQAEVSFIAKFLHGIQNKRIIKLSYCQFRSHRRPCPVKISDQLQVRLDRLRNLSFNILEVENVIKKLYMFTSYVLN